MAHLQEGYGAGVYYNTMVRTAAFAREWRARRTPESMQRVFLDDLRARFDAQGYVVVENYLDADVVEACREELDAVLRCAREGAGVKIPIIRPAIRGN